MPFKADSPGRRGDKKIAEDVRRVGRTYFTPERRYHRLHQPVVTVASGALWRERRQDWAWRPGWAGESGVGAGGNVSITVDDGYRPYREFLQTRDP
jgi:hypothetical protein